MILFYRENPCNPIDSRPSNSEYNLGILFIIIDDFPNELLWRLWLEHGGVNNQNTASTSPTSTNNKNSNMTVQCWFHAKYPDRIRSSWVRERLVKSFQFKPEWGSLDLTKVMVHMLHEVSVYI